MKKVITKQIRVVEATTGKAFQELFNKAMIDLADKNPEELIKTNEGHCAYIRYEETRLEPENIREEYHLRGIEYVCGQCPYFVENEDKRIKYADCPKIGYKVRASEGACLYFYQRVAEGEIKVDDGVSEEG